MDLSFKGSCKNKNVEIITFLYHEDYLLNIVRLMRGGELPETELNLILLTLKISTIK